MPKITPEKAHPSRIKTEHLYPDGDVIDVFVIREPRSVIVTDLGETERWLHMQNIDESRDVIDEFCLKHGLEFLRGMLRVELGPLDFLIGAVERVALAAKEITETLSKTSNPNLQPS